MVSQDGGVPLLSKSWDGNTSDIEVFQERAQALIETLQNSRARAICADCKLYHETMLQTCNRWVITRIPQTLKLVSQVIRQALAMDTWHRLDEQTSYQRLDYATLAWSSAGWWSSRRRLPGAPRAR